MKVSAEALLMPVRKLREADFFNADHITVYTPLCTNFEVERVKRGAYVARNRTEFVGGVKGYRSLEEMKKDLQPR